MLLHVVDGVIENVFVLFIRLLEDQARIAGDESGQPAHQIIGGMESVALLHELPVQRQHIRLIRTAGDSRPGENGHQLQGSHPHRLILAAGGKEDIAQDLIEEPTGVPLISLRNGLHQLLLLVDGVGGWCVLELILLQILPDRLVLLRLVAPLDHSHAAVAYVQR